MYMRNEQQNKRFHLLRNKPHSSILSTFDININEFDRHSYVQQKPVLADISTAQTRLKYSKRQRITANHWAQRGTVSDWNSVASTTDTYHNIKVNIPISQSSFPIQIVDYLAEVMILNLYQIKT